MRASPLIRLLALALLVPLITAGSCSQGNTRPALPAVGPPVHTVTEKLVYVAIPPRLTEHAERIPAGSLADSPFVAAQRGKALKVCWANLDEIGAIEGTPVPPKGKP